MFTYSQTFGHDEQIKEADISVSVDTDGSMTVKIEGLGTVTFKGAQIQNFKAKVDRAAEMSLMMTAKPNPLRPVI